jgi:two-component system response regulator YesN
MYRVVIIDDEDIIAEGLKRVVDWSKFRCEVVATGQDAVSGAMAIRTHKPHILFTDIKMPNVSGLTMLAGVRSEFPDMLVTVLTGYRDFEYAKEAISLGVARFLLKPSKMDELEEALSYMTAALDKLQPSEKEPLRQAPGDSVAVDTANSFLVRQAHAYIKEHYEEKISLQDVADHCYVSQWHLSKLLHKHLGEAFYDLLNGIRVDKAKVLLENPALRISEIASLVGYADTAHFSRVFKKREGISANEYRNLHCGGK